MESRAGSWERRFFGFLLLRCMLCLGLLTACGSPSHAQQIEAGRTLYISHCSHCHQPEGQGYAQVFPPLAGNPIVKLGNPEPTIEIVLHGRGSMPSYQDELTSQERAQIITYIRRAWGNNASPVSPSQVQ
jgi:mono/diheme cytochrome c family protein